jgi:cytoskeletal protein CcmA (bactofilin family)
MWNKRDESARPQFQPTPPTAPMSVRPASVSTSPPPAPAAPRQSAVIGASMRIKGEINSREELIIDGEVEGAVESQSLVTIGKNGKVKANIKAREVAIFGSVHGDVDATDKIAIRDQGSLVGNIKTAGISIDDGAYFKGSIDIIRPEPKTVKMPDQKVQAS